MNKSAFLKLIQQASSISDQQTEELEKMAVAFPYCQTAHLLLAKSAYEKGSMLSAQRLRRAASYATNRQILKRVIYTSAAEPVFESIIEQDKPVEITTAPVFEAEVTEAVEQPETESLNEAIEVSSSNSTVSDAPEESEVVPEEIQEDTLLQQETVLEEDLKQDASESELLSLLTISSLSPSFTDLLAQEPDPIPDTEATNTAETLPEPESDFSEVESITADHKLSEEQQVASNLIEESSIPDRKEELPENAEIKYAPDEIDRLYAEDALGYWMGSSRMGEQLLLKNEYTRPKPQSFHPELILEYNKTHELEKAIQAPTNILSRQLDIIDQFLKLNPRLKTKANLKLKEEPQEDLSIKSSKIKKSMASENLASIFIKQGKFKKAIKIYEHLILKNPEKKTYFAEQIEKLQTKI